MQTTGTLKRGTQTILTDWPLAFNESPHSKFERPSYFGWFHYPEDMDLEIGQSLTLVLADGRSGEIIIQSTDRSSLSMLDIPARFVSNSEFSR